MSTASKRIASIDMIRGIAIVGMVLCANIGFNSGLPAWMFHAQTPPPTYAFNPDVAGLTWVDLVFPFFLFPMGAAFPFAMRKRLERGQSRWSVAGSLVKRWIILTLFAILLGNAYALGGSAQPAWQQWIFNITLWIALFLSLVRVNITGEGWKKHLGTAINIAGLAMIGALALVFTRHFGLSINKAANDIIIMILAVIAITGGLIWMFTKDNLRLRWLIILLVGAFKALDSYLPQTLDFVPSCSCISWFFNWEWLQYLLIVLPGSIVGDMILAHSRSGEKALISNKQVAGGIIALAAVLVQLWGLFTRNVLADFIISAALAGVFVALTWKERNIFIKTAWTGFALMLVGIIFDPLDGGITKDYCNLSYLFTTGGMAALVTAFLLMLELRYGVKGPFLAGVGQNPMLAYTVTSFLIGPILNFAGILPWLSGLAVGSQFWGVMIGVIITFLMMCVTYSFTRLKLFWRS
ncbi:MAG: DUF5009 domain-containing protein [Bacteroidales bacterium]|nr:DUF5009 domain-containing protein [Bacteroidales bacterium]